MRAALALPILMLAMARCGGTAPPPDPGPIAAADPSSGCQRALSHLIDLSIRATGSGPTDAQRSQFLRRCLEARSGRANDCVLRLRRLPGRSGEKVQLGPALTCLRR